ncbi:hypothetical protein B0H15DRAFT_238027 [Mycena belliarum]|uniref:Uncharacterized protein n=1 Tax=Mycena belliarum TaxID=1033014 RepID=A0AAD6U6N9_9AGAR|nr:hypothetical protein B0H15DRAFT_238027 [Mycena belliae]
MTAYRPNQARILCNAANPILSLLWVLNVYCACTVRCASCIGRLLLTRSESLNGCCGYATYILPGGRQLAHNNERPSLGSLGPSVSVSSLLPSILVSDSDPDSSCLEK